MKNVTKTRVTCAAAGVALGGALMVTGVGVAGADPMMGHAGVDLSVGNVKILQNADMEKATTVIGAVCNIDAAQANSITEKASSESMAQTACTAPGGAVTLSQTGSVDTGLPPSVGMQQAPMNGQQSPMNMQQNPVAPGNTMLPSEQQPR